MLKPFPEEVRGFKACCMFFYDLAMANPREAYIEHKRACGRFGIATPTSQEFLGLAARISVFINDVFRSYEQARRSIGEIVVGPAAPNGAEDEVRELLRTVHVDPGNVVRRSDIPFRVL